MRNVTILPPFLREILSLTAADALAPGGASLARLVAGLAEREAAEGGPYLMEGEHAPDLGANVAIALFLRNLDVRLPNLDAYLEQALAKGAPQSRYLDTPALAELIRRYRSTASSRERRDPWTDEERAMLTQVRDLLAARLSALPDAFADVAHEAVNRTIAGNPDKQMPLMPLFMRQALGAKGARFSDRYIAELGLANVFFWTAFIIYDDFWDLDEAAEPRLLPAANLFARHYAQFFSTRPSATGFPAFFASLMDRLDAANEWELLSCRMRRTGDTLAIPQALPEYGTYEKKFYPAAGHVLGPVLMLAELGFGVGSPETQGFMAYCRHYLIAMQMNDDLHDWKEDLSRGHISTAVRELLAAWKSAHPDRAHLDVAEDMPELERLFWYEAMPAMCRKVLQCAQRAEETLHALSFIEDRAPLQRFVDRNREAAQNALDEHRQGLDFLRSMEAQISSRKI